MHYVPENRPSAPLALTGQWVDFVHRFSHMLLTHPFKGAGYLAFQIPKLLLPNVSGRVIVRTIEGFDLVVDPTTDIGVQKALYLCGTYEPGTLEVIRCCLRPGDLFVDAGSNIGVMSIFASKLVGPDGAVYAFEPEPEVYSQFLENLALNGCENVRPFLSALGSARATTGIYVDPVNKGHSSLVRPRSSNTAARQVEVRALDEVLASSHPSRVRMVKIDVEGWELEVLKGGRNLFCDDDAPIASIECSRLHALSGGTVADLLHWIIDVNEYSVYKDRRGMPPLIPVVSEADLPVHGNLYCFLPSHQNTIPKRLFAQRVST